MEFGGLNPPFRQGCALPCWLGPQFQNSRAAEQSVPCYSFNAKVAGYDDGTPIDPYERFQSNPGAPGCETDGCIHDSDGTNHQLCNPWIANFANGYTVTNPPPLGFARPNMITAMEPADGGSGYVVGDVLRVPHTACRGDTPTTYGTPCADSGTLAPESNGSSAYGRVTKVDGTGKILPGGITVTNPSAWFSNPPSPSAMTGGSGTGASITLTFSQLTVNLGACRQRGTRNVQVARSWHGHPGFLSHPCNDGYVTCVDGSVAHYENYQSTAPSTRYLKLTYDFSLSFVATGTIGRNPANPFMGNTSASGSLTIDPLSGAATSTLYTTDYYNSFTSEYVSNGGAGYEDFGTSGGDDFRNTFFSGGMAEADGSIFDPACTANIAIPFSAVIFYGTIFSGVHLADLPAIINGAVPHGIAPVTDPFNYSGSFSYDDVYGHAVTISFGWILTDTEFSFYLDFSNPDYDISDAVVPLTASFSGTISLSDENIQASVTADAVGLVALWPLDDNKLWDSWSLSGYENIAPLVCRDEKGNTSPALGFQPYTVPNLTSPITDANGNAPWTYAPSGGDCTTDPPPPGWTCGTANNDEFGHVPSDPNYDGAKSWVPTYSQIPWFDPVVYVWKIPSPANPTDVANNARIHLQYDGHIIGAPAAHYITPVAGAVYRDWFDFYAQDWHVCLNDPETTGCVNCTDWWIYGDGLKNTGQYGLPLMATHWTNQFRGIHNFPQAWMLFNDKSILGNNLGAENGGALWLQKHAETLETIPSINLARPAGSGNRNASAGDFDGKFAYDETKVYQVENISGSGAGSTWNLKDSDGNTPGSLDLSGTWGGAAVGGFYTGCSYAVSGSVGTVTLGTKAWDLPSNWVSRSGDDATCFGALRWPTAPALLGKIPVTVDVTGKIFTYAPQPAFGMAHGVNTEQVDLLAQDFSVVASNVTAMRTADTTFTTATAYPASKWVVIHGAPDWKWCDNASKGQCAVLKWRFNARALAEAIRWNSVVAGEGPCGDGTSVGSPVTVPPDVVYELDQIQLCVPRVPCQPGVVSISPNSENFDPAGTVTLDMDTPLDGEYQSQYQAEVVQAVPDPLWQSPHRPPSVALGNWTMDDGSGESDSDTKVYYPLHPLVEPLLELPAGAPALPDGCYLGFIAPGDSGPGDVANPPGVVDNTGNTLSGFDTIQNIKIRLENNVCANGRFADIYRDNYPDIRCP
jgi:hypothetical protein